MNNQDLRSKTYAVIASIGSLLTLYGVVSEDEVAHWLDLVSNLLVVIPLWVAAYFSSKKYAVTKVDNPKHLE